MWLIFSQNMVIANCKVWAFLSSILDQNLKIVERSAGPLKLETYKGHDKTF